MSKLTLCVLLMTCAVIADGVANAANEANPAATQRPRGSAAKGRRTGGFVKKPGTAQGKVVFLNAQKRVPFGQLASALEVIDARIHAQVEPKDVEKVDVTTVADAVKAAEAKLGVALVDSTAGIPALLVAPEEGWAVVNVAKLAVDAPAADVLAARVRKEMLRAFALVGGAAFMARDPVVMRADVLTAKDLDGIRMETYGVDASHAMEMNLPRLGVMPWRVTTYLLACQEGWAPAPTNEFQKAIWEKVHAVPTKPITIEKK